MLARAARELGAVRVAADLEAARGAGANDALKDQVLRTAKRFGKARFAQVTARHSGQAGDLPPYIRQAIEWLLAA
jgi:putative ATP-dependent endonuclease of the OLD family